MAELQRPLEKVLGGKTAKALETHLGLLTVEDLLRHYPRRYYERGELTDLASLREGEHVTIQVDVVHAAGRQIRDKLHKVDVVVTDGRTKFTVTFFNRRYLANTLPPGTSVLLAGKVGRFKKTLQLTNPELHIGDEVDEFASGLRPIYPASAKVASWVIRNAMQVVLDTLGDLPDPLPDDVRRRRKLVPLADAMRMVHRPADHAEVRRARDRLQFDEAFLLQVVLAQRRASLAALPATPRVANGAGLRASFDARLPFELTKGQVSVSSQIAEDLARSHPMHRLLQGEVGSGKTVVALRAMLSVVDAGGQAALLAPTEVLAVQHHRSITAMLGDLAEHGMLGGADVGTRVALLTGSQPTSVRKRALLDVVSGDAGIVVGTHALIQDTVDFHDLGLVVVDEQHRFGVEQRDALRAKAAQPPHVLVMTATPIPRTVAMTVFGDLDVSTLTELPLGRSPITTHVVPAAEKPRFLERAWQRVREEVAAGHQAYVVCPRIGPTDADEGLDESLPDVEGSRRPPIALLELIEDLRGGALQGLRVEALHGRLPTDEKDAVMRRFAAGDVDVLVATTVIEVGVDVANATAMVVMDADRFGVSQLHQLRGRVGRGSAPAICLLVTDAEENSPARDRLDAVAATLDGFELSRVDLESRREGDVLGASQSGRRSSLRLLRVFRDQGVIEAARDEATTVVAADTGLTGHPGLRQAVDALLDEERADYLEKA